MAQPTITIAIIHCSGVEGDPPTRPELTIPGSAGLLARMSPESRVFRILSALVGGLVMAGCAGIHDIGPPSAPATRIPMPVRFREAPAQAARTTFGTGSWWTMLGNRDLDRQVAAALGGNPGLREAASRITMAGASLRQARARLFPALDASGGTSRRWDDNRSGTSGTTSASFGTLLDWEADVFGRLEAARRAGEAEVAATRADLAGARLVLSAAVAETYFARVEQTEQLKLLHEQTEVGETLLRLTRLRFGQGQASIVDVLQQEEQLKETRALVPVVEARIAELGYALDAFRGHAPSGAPPTPGAVLPEPPPLPAIGVPSDLLLARPDLVAGRARLFALDARLVEAMADRLPEFRISAATISAHGNASSLVSNLAASVVAPLFDAGERRAEVAKRRAELEGAVAAFADLFLRALREVESALVNERKESERLARQLTQLDTAKRLLSETRNRYSQGLTDYLPVLAALTTVQELERRIVTTRRNRISHRIALHRALGGPMP